MVFIINLVIYLYISTSISIYLSIYVHIYIYIYISWRIIRKCTPFNTTKKNIICVWMKSLKSLHIKETIYWAKCQSLLTIVDTRTNLPFYGMITRAKSYVFTVIFLVLFPLEPTFSPALFMFCIYGFQNRNRAAQSDGFIGGYCREYFL